MSELQSAEARRPQLGKPLTPRESQVLAMLARGLTNAEIAEGLGVTVHAVKFHLHSVYVKLGVRNRTSAAMALAQMR